MLYIDAFNHILPKKYQAVLEQKVPNRDMSSNLSRYAETVPTLLDLDARSGSWTAWKATCRCLRWRPPRWNPSPRPKSPWICAASPTMKWRNWSKSTPTASPPPSPPCRSTISTPALRKSTAPSAISACGASRCTAT